MRRTVHTKIYYQKCIWLFFPTCNKQEISFAFEYDCNFLISELRLCSKDIGCCCPICGLPLRSSELESHYTQELDYLAKLSAALVVSQEHKNNVRRKFYMQDRLNRDNPQKWLHCLAQKLISPSSSPNVKSQHSPGIASMEIAPRSRWDVSDFFKYIFL